MRATPNVLASCFAGKICFLRHEALGVGSDDLLEPFLDVIVDEGEKSTHGPPSDDARLLEIKALPHEGFEMEGLPHGEPIVLDAYVAEINKNAPKHRPRRDILPRRDFDVLLPGVGVLQHLTGTLLLGVVKVQAANSMLVTAHERSDQLTMPTLQILQFLSFLTNMVAIGVICIRGCPISSEDERLVDGPLLLIDLGLQQAEAQHLQDNALRHLTRIHGLDEG